MKFEEIEVDGKKEVIITDLDESFYNDLILTDDLEDTIEIPVQDIKDNGDNNG